MILDPAEGHDGALGARTAASEGNNVLPSLAQRPYDINRTEGNLQHLLDLTGTRADATGVQGLRAMAWAVISSVAR
ncbi:MAG: hypothetical protein HQM01_09235 [Magnetococcales bacterium]|nr:hypothetical protein [Magnetococcales bacterium]